jgi:hypothetical protein
MRRPLLAACLVVLSAASAPRDAHAQTRFTLKADGLFYGDNTEFFNRYRTGETTLGVWGRVFVSAELAPNVEVRAGVFGNERFGSEKSFELVRPVLALRIGTERSRFVFGSLETVRDAGAGPDRLTLHGLLPPIQMETLALNRPHEAGVQWLLATERVSNDLGLNWQKLNTPEHREVLDAGTAGRVSVFGPFAVGAQVHVVHHGGQLYDVGPVSDSWAYALGAIASPRVTVVDSFEAELWGLASKDKPNREAASETTSGRAAFLRLAAVLKGFRAHLILWRATDFAKEEGDPNYLSRGEDGVFHPGRRNYAELGLAKVFHPVAGVALDASARLHRVESKIEYSYRLVARVELGVPLGGGR